MTETQFLLKRRLLILHEFGPNSREWFIPRILPYLVESSFFSDITYRNGFLHQYTSGGLSLLRVINLVYCYFTFPFWIFRDWPDTILVRTAPPAIQVWIAFWGWLFRKRVICWMMDFHPEIEIRYLSKRYWTKPLGILLDCLNRWSLQKMYSVIAIDHAIVDVCRDKSPKLSVTFFPVWTPNPIVNYSLDRNSHEPNFNFLYMGNLGFSHETETLKRILRIYPEKKFNFHVVNPSSNGKSFFKSLEAFSNCDVVFYSKLDNDQLFELIKYQKISWGLVLLKLEACGVVSPSKFLSYLELGLPIFYVGGEKSNADFSCNFLGVGIAIRPEISEDQLHHILSNALSQEDYAMKIERLDKALGFFSDYGPQQFAERLISICKNDVVA